MIFPEEKAGLLEALQGNPNPTKRIHRYTHGTLYLIYLLRESNRSRWLACSGRNNLYHSGLYANIDEDITSFPAVTDETGRYQFTYDQAPATEHTLYARLSPSFSDPQYPWKTDSIVVNFGEN